MLTVKIFNHYNHLVLTQETDTLSKAMQKARFWCKSDRNKYYAVCENENLERQFWYDRNGFDFGEPF